MSCTPFTVLCSEDLQTPSCRHPYRGSHPTHQAQDCDTLSRSHTRHTTDGATESLRPSPTGPRPYRQGRRAGKVKHGTNAARSNCLTSSPPHS